MGRGRFEVAIRILAGTLARLLAAEHEACLNAMVIALDCYASFQGQLKLIEINNSTHHM